MPYKKWPSWCLSLQWSRGRERERERAMVRSPCCSKEGLNRGAWTSLEDTILTAYIRAHGEGKWRNLPKRAGNCLFVLQKQKCCLEVFSGLMGFSPILYFLWFLYLPTFPCFLKILFEVFSVPPLFSQSWSSDDKRNLKLSRKLKPYILIKNVQVWRDVGRVVDWDGSTIWDQISREGTSLMMKRSSSSDSTNFSVTGRFSTFLFSKYLVKNV